MDKTALKHTNERIVFGKFAETMVCFLAKKELPKK